MKFISILALVVSLITVGVVLNHPTGRGSSAPPETAFDRVIKTGTLRCGYAVATPWFYIDPNTNQKQGVSYDVTMAIAEKMNLKVDWVEETGWGVAEQGLAAGRYDVMCGNVCIDANRTRAATFSDAFIHIPLLAVVRDDDHRFDEGLTNIDKSDIRIVVKNG